MENPTLPRFIHCLCAFFFRDTHGCKMDLVNAKIHLVSDNMQIVMTVLIVSVTGLRSDTPLLLPAPAPQPHKKRSGTPNAASQWEAGHFKNWGEIVSKIITAPNIHQPWHRPPPSCSNRQPTPSLIRLNNSKTFLSISSCFYDIGGVFVNYLLK